MPVYTCTTAESTVTSEDKAALAGEISRIHSAINHVPSTYVNVVFHELPSDSVYTDGVPARPLLISGWVRDGHRRTKPPALQPKSLQPPRGSRVFRQTGCWSSSKAAQRISQSKAAASYPNPAKRPPGSPRATGRSRPCGRFSNGAKGGAKGNRIPSPTPGDCHRRTPLAYSAVAERCCRSRQVGAEQNHRVSVRPVDGA